MTTIYKKPAASPYHAMKRSTYAVQETEHPVRREIAKLLGNYAIIATVEEDLQTMATFKHVPGLVAFLCTISKDGEVIGQGRGTATFNPNAKGVSRTVKLAFNGSLIDAMIRSTRVLDTFTDDMGSGGSFGTAYEPREIEAITDRQKSYLRQLIASRIADEAERDQMMSELETMTKDDASAVIQNFTK
jgi:hypothetical protein